MAGDKVLFFVCTQDMWVSMQSAFKTEILNLGNHIQNEMQVFPMINPIILTQCAETIFNKI